ncbi:hypothetical protein L3Y34_000095 [Caenorhabditis briggsae]|uniref:RING-type domain-containing protein n=1 Tax=Caenorhabditis briggsae TaxID=6238 RepID=A0AAE9D8G6_CAEBR|nr:hypothetical protein L3Y34_000095 [Caenorhabditis briggsae]
MIIPPFLTNYVQLANLAITIIASIVAYILTPIYLGQDYFLRLNIYFLVASIFVGIVIWSYNYVLSDYLAKINLINSFGLIFICGISAKLWIFLQPDADLLVLFYIFFTFNVISAFLYSIVHKHIRIYQMKYRGRFGIIFFGILVNGLALVLGITKGLEYEKKFGVIFFQSYYSFFTASLLDLMVGYWGGLQKYQPRHIELLQIGGQRQPAHSGCPICIEKFSETEIPRILKCGHTICQQCARNLKGDTNKIQCPTCRQETIVEGSIDSLPKNFAVLDIQHENEQV